MAARAVGASNRRIFLRHITPNILGPIVVIASLDVGWIILGIAGLSFLGLGAQPPTPEWGAMLNDARPFLQTAPRLLLWPGRPSSSRCWGSTCSVTACATFWLPYLSPKGPTDGAAIPQMPFHSGRSSLAALAELLAANDFFGSADWLEFALEFAGGALFHGFGAGRVPVVSAILCRIMGGGVLSPLSILQPEATRRDRRTWGSLSFLQLSWTLYNLMSVSSSVSAPPSASFSPACCLGRSAPALDVQRSPHFGGSSAKPGVGYFAGGCGGNRDSDRGGGPVRLLPPECGLRPGQGSGGHGHLCGGLRGGGRTAMGAVQEVRGSAGRGAGGLDQGQSHGHFRELSGADSTSMVPPWPRTMSLERARPRPVPSLVGFVVKKD